MKVDFISIFPAFFESYLKESLFRRAITSRILKVKVHDLRDFSKERHRKVDDKPFGGGPGMVLQIEPFYRALKKILPKKDSLRNKTRVILLSPRGQKFDSRKARELAECYDRLVFLCGRYEGIDERVATHLADESISIGDYVLSGGELPALVALEAIMRYRPGFLGKIDSLEDERGSFPAYSRPAVFKPNKKTSWSVPPELLTGHHARIKKWREAR